MSKGNEIKIRALALIVVAATAGFLVVGCAGGYYTSGAYYAPRYGAYYTDYGYRGGSYYSGYNPGYIGGFVISGGHRYHRYYGHHHFHGQRHAIHRRHAGRSDNRGGRSGSHGHHRHRHD